MARPTEYQFELLMQIEDGRRKLEKIRGKLFGAGESGLSKDECDELGKQADEALSDLRIEFAEEDES